MPNLFDPDPGYDGKLTSELVALVNNSRKSASVRFAAAIALGRRSKQDPELVSTLHEIATCPQKRETRMLHGVSLAYIAVAGLMHCGTSSAIAAVSDAMTGFDNADQDSLKWFLKAGGLEPTNGI